ncbi:unnamed protein product, partial [Phaeothamnion confervicola]
MKERVGRQYSEAYKKRCGAKADEWSSTGPPQISDGQRRLPSRLPVCGLLLSGRRKLPLLRTLAGAGAGAGTGTDAGAVAGAEVAPISLPRSSFHYIGSCCCDCRRGNCSDGVVGGDLNADAAGGGICATQDCSSLVCATVRQAAAIDYALQRLAATVMAVTAMMVAAARRIGRRKGFIGLWSSGAAAGPAPASAMGLIDCQFFYFLKMLLPV